MVKSYHIIYHSLRLIYLNFEFHQILMYYHFFDKIKCMFSRGNAAIINLDKQISKLVEKSNKLDEDIAKIKTHMESIQSESY